MGTLAYLCICCMVFPGALEGYTFNALVIPIFPGAAEGQGPGQPGRLAGGHGNHKAELLQN